MYLTKERYAGNYSSDPEHNRDELASDPPASEPPAWTAPSEEELKQLNYEQAPWWPSTGAVATIIGMQNNAPFWTYYSSYFVKKCGSDIPLVTIPFFLKWVVGTDNFSLDEAL